MAPDGVLICIDPYPVGRFGFSSQRLIALKEVSKVRNGTVSWVRMTGADAGRQKRTGRGFHFHRWRPFLRWTAPGLGGVERACRDWWRHCLT